MPGVPGRSGGRNRRSLREHQLRGTVRPARHLPPTTSQPGDLRVKRPRGLTRAQRAVWDALAPVRCNTLNRQVRNRVCSAFVIAPPL